MQAKSGKEITAGDEKIVTACPYMRKCVEYGRDGRTPSCRTTRDGRTDKNSLDVFSFYLFFLVFIVFPLDPLVKGYLVRNFPVIPKEIPPRQCHIYRSGMLSSQAAVRMRSKRRRFLVKRKAVLVCQSCRRMAPPLE